MNYPPILFHPINTITAYKGQIIYDTPETEAKAQTPVPYLQWMPAPGVTPPQIPPDVDLQLLLPPPAPGQLRQARRHRSRPARGAGGRRPPARRGRMPAAADARRQGQADDAHGVRGVASAPARCCWPAASSAG